MEAGGAKRGVNSSMEPSTAANGGGSKNIVNSRTHSSIRGSMGTPRTATSAGTPTKAGRKKEQGRAASEIFATGRDAINNRNANDSTDANNRRDCRNRSVANKKARTPETIEKSHTSFS